MMLVIVLAGNCGACKQFKESGQLESVKNEIRKVSKMPIVEIQLSAMGESLPSNVNGYKIPSDLSSYIYMYPTFMIVDESQDKVDKSKLLIYGVSLSAEKPIRMPTAMTVPEWVLANSKTVTVSPNIKKIPTEGTYKLVSKR
jgi:hypothetical protein